MRFGLKKRTTSVFDGWRELSSIGEKEKFSEFGIVVHSKVNEAVELYCKSELKKEVGGVLIGLDKNEKQVEIVGAIEAKYAEHQAASLTFTHQSWEYIHEVKERKYPKLKIVGWFHTHPGYGIFLSSYDIFIHKNFFSLPYQVALVIDPCQNQRGFFAWKDEKVIKLPNYYVGVNQEKIPDLKLKLEGIKS